MRRSSLLFALALTGCGWFDDADDPDVDDLVDSGLVDSGLVDAADIDAGGIDAGPPSATCPRAIGGPGRQLAHGIAEREDRIAVVGSFDGSIDLGDGSVASDGLFDAFVAIYDLDCRLIAARTLGGTGEQQLFDVVFDAKGGLVVIGYVDGTIDLGDGEESGSRDGFVAAFDADLEPRWHVMLASSPLADEVATAFPAALTLDETGAPIVAGYFSGSLSAGSCSGASHGVEDGFVARFEPDGCTWLRSWGSEAGQTQARAVVVAGDGGLVIGGMTQGDVDFGTGDVLGYSAFLLGLDAGGEPIWARPWASSFAVEHLIVLGDQIVGAGEVWPALLAPYDLFVESFAPGDGAPAWSRTWTGEGSRFALGLAHRSGDVVLLAGYWGQLVPEEVEAAEFGAALLVLGDEGATESIEVLPDSVLCSVASGPRVAHVCSIPPATGDLPGHEDIVLRVER